MAKRNQSYSDSLEKVLEENLVVNTSLDDLFIVRQIDQHCEGIFGDCGIILDQKLEIRDRLEGVALEQTRLSGTESNQVFGGCRSCQSVIHVSLIWQDIRTDLANLGVAMVKELNELDSCQSASKYSRITSDSPPRVLKA